MVMYYIPDLWEVPTNVVILTELGQWLYKIGQAVLDLEDTNSKPGFILSYKDKAVVQTCL